MLRLAQRWRDRASIPILQVRDDARLVRAKSGDIATLAPFGGELALQLHGITVDPCRGGGVGEIDALGLVGNVRLEAIRQPRLAEDEVLHEAEDRGAECITL